jgi:hypothetical protein
VIGAVCLCVALPLTAGIYYWTDENGVRHYSNVAPAESGDEVQQQEEVPTPAPESRSPTRRPGTGPKEPASSGVKAPAETSPPESADAKDKPTEQSGTDSTTESAAGAVSVPTEQNEIVRKEKAAVKDLQRQLEEDTALRDKFIERERKRLQGALEQLQKTPVSEFGSQKNKTRAMGYYRYRLEALQESPDRYFTYGDSDID